MADIAMCRGEGCPMAKDCKRHTARPNPHRQAYFTDVPYKDGKCEKFWGDDQEMIMKQLKDIVNGKVKK